MPRMNEDENRLAAAVRSLDVEETMTAAEKDAVIEQIYGRVDDVPAPVAAIPTGGRELPTGPALGKGREDPVGHSDLESHLGIIFTVARATALSKGANTYEADEVAQLTAYKLWRRWEDPMVATLRSIGGTRWRGYIRKAATNTHIDETRQHQRRLAREARAEESRTGRHLTEAAGDLRPAPIGNIEQWLARHNIHDLILRLPAQQQKVAARVWLLEMSVHEAAQELGLQDQTVRKHARAARETLRSWLTDPNREPQTIL